MKLQMHQQVYILVYTISLNLQVSIYTYLGTGEISRHMVVFCVANNPACNTVSILTGRKMRFLQLLSSVLQNKTIFAVDTPTNVSTPHTKFEQNQFKHSQHMRLQN